jgi:hypothetical protein
MTNFFFFAYMHAAFWQGTQALMCIALLASLVALFGFFGWFIAVLKDKDDGSAFMLHTINAAAFASIFTGECIALVYQDDPQFSLSFQLCSFCSGSSSSPSR